LYSGGHLIAQGKLLATSSRLITHPATTPGFWISRAGDSSAGDVASAHDKPHRSACSRHPAVSPPVAQATARGAAVGQHSRVIHSWFSRAALPNEAVPAASSASR